MLEPMSVLDEMEIVPEPGQFYTFIYTAKTPNIRYDEFPLIACTDVEQWDSKVLTSTGAQVETTLGMNVKVVLYLINLMK